MYRYEPFGRAAADGDTSTNSLQYTARENDGTGLQYSRARYYSPSLHRFISEDPLGLKGGDTNFYAYVRNSPTTFRDPLGLRIEWGNFVLNNPYVIANLYKLNQAIIDSGVPSDQFVLQITGGDRYIDRDGKARSATNNEIVGDTKSEHIIKNGARGVDLKVTGLSEGKMLDALPGTDFSPDLTVPEAKYPKGPHTHLALPKGPNCQYCIPPDSIPPELQGRDSQPPGGRDDYYGP